MNIENELVKLLEQRNQQIALCHQAVEAIEGLEQQTRRADAILDGLSEWFENLTSVRDAVDESELICPEREWINLDEKYKPEKAEAAVSKLRSKIGISQKDIDRIVKRLEEYVGVYNEEMERINEVQRLRDEVVELHSDRLDSIAEAFDEEHPSVPALLSYLEEKEWWGETISEDEIDGIILAGDDIPEPVEDIRGKVRAVLEQAKKDEDEDEEDEDEYEEDEEE